MNTADEIHTVPETPDLDQTVADGKQYPRAHQQNDQWRTPDKPGNLVY